ncbi:hypothetical protein [Paeniglutamicibacter antarcticus]|uniref:Uncharacterized protein n=1 Tax=Paeniglutamicibacter antarcticus TaxID=494023 RepID=A0ABP9TJA0_9MICC
MGNNHHEDERYKKFYDRPPQGEVPTDPRVKNAMESGADPEDDEPSEDAAPEAS